MSRISVVTEESAGPVTKLVYKGTRRQFGGRLPEPVRVYAHHPLFMHAYGAFEFAFQRSNKAPEHLKMLAEMKAAARTGCEWCLDFGTWLSRGEGITERKLTELHRFRESDAYSEEEKLVIEYAEAMSNTPVDVSDELVARLRERFSDAQIVELTWAAAIENMRARINYALGIESQDYMEGAACTLPERPATPTDVVEPARAS